jgi:hypothetical protein
MESSTRLCSVMPGWVLDSKKRHAPATRPSAINATRWDNHDNLEYG